jgi:DNA polymerase-3 subunit epsilon
MMRLRPVVSFAAAITALAGASAGALIAGSWLILEPAIQTILTDAFKARAAPLIFVGLCSLAVIAGVAYSLAHSRLAFVSRLIHALEILRVSHPGHRVSGNAAIPKALARAVDTLAEDYEQRRRNIEQEIAEATAALQRDRDLLAALLADFHEALLVCAEDGRVLLYNSRARDLLVGSLEDGSLLGLGRSLFTLFPHSVIVHGLERLRMTSQRGETDPACTTLINTRQGKVLRAQFRPFAGQRIRGFLLALNDVTHASKLADARSSAVAQAESLRGPISSARLAVDALRDFPGMPEERRARFTAIVHEEMETLGSRLDSVLNGVVAVSGESRSLDEMPANVLLQLLRGAMEARLGRPVEVSDSSPDLWVRADSYTLSLAVCFLALQLQHVYGTGEFVLRAQNSGAQAAVDLLWRGATNVEARVWRLWEETLITTGADSLPYSLHDVMRRHHGEVWLQQESSGEMFVRFLLNVAATPPGIRESTSLTTGSRPEFFDFDPFEGPVGAGLQAQSRLAELRCTAFDTETTGLDPKGGDQIIALGAIRILKGRVLGQEVFESLVTTHRRIAPEAMRVHGITPDQLRGQPRLEQIVPRFHRFCGDTVLVGHNAAFDLRFLQLQEQATGIRFEQPVLDTLLLSAVVYPDSREHELEAIAARLGVSVIGRHTALGDAILTAEVFVRLLPLLESKGIVKLSDALEASARTYYARIGY